MQDLRQLSTDELQAKLELKPFKIKEIFRFIHQKLGTNLDDLTTIKLAERELLKEGFFISNITPAKVQKDEKTIKVAFKLEDDNIIEAVFMDNDNDRKTVCISSQVGCPIGCDFCATGKLGFTRNLTAAEILSQVYYFAREYRISNIVFMGMGEPFLNYENVLKAGKILNNALGLNIASRKLVYSTVGIVAGIKKFAEEKEQFRFSWSLATPFDETRQKLIPFPGIKSINETVKAIKDYQKKTKRRVTIEYIVLKGINDSAQDYAELAKIAKEMDSHINLIAYNPSPGSQLKSGNVEEAFQALKKHKLVVTVRRSYGKKISAACGQLAG